MSMQISNSTSFAANAVSSHRPRELRQDFRDLRQALRSGDLDAASSAYAALASDAPKLVGRKPDGGLTQVGAALAAGDMAGAQTAFSTMLRSHLPRAGGHSMPAPPTEDPAPSAPVSLAPGAVDLTA